MRRHLTQVINDLDGSLLEEKSSTSSFKRAGRAHEIDLSPSNVEARWFALGPCTRAGRVVRSVRRR
jgi:hypothetical protein